MDIDSYINSPSSYKHEFSAENKEIVDFFFRLFILYCERKYPIYKESSEDYSKSKIKNEENEKKLENISSSLGFSKKELELLLRERSIVEGYFKDILDVKIFLTDKHELLRDMFVDIFTSLRYKVTTSKRLRDLYSLPEREVEELLRGIGFLYVEDLLPDISKSIFFNNVLEFYKKKGNSFVLKDMFNYFISTKNIGVLNEWWLYFMGEDKKKANDSDFYFVSKPIWDTKEQHEEYYVTSLPYKVLIENDPHWYYSKDGNPKISKIYSSKEEELLPSLTPYISFNYYYKQNEMIKDFSILCRRLNEYITFFLRDCLSLKDIIDDTSIISVIIDGFKNNLKIITKKKTTTISLKDFEYIIINNRYYIKPYDGFIYQTSGEFFETIPIEYNIFADKKDRGPAYNLLYNKIMENLRYTYSGIFNRYISEMDAFLAMSYLKRGIFFEKFSYLGKFDSFNLDFTIGYDVGDYIEYNNKLYIFYNRKWWEIYMPAYTIQQIKDRFLNSRSIIFIREIYPDNIVENNFITEYNPSSIFTFLNYDYKDPFLNEKIKDRFSNLLIDITSIDSLSLLLPYNIFINKNYIKNEYNNIFNIPIPNFLKKFVSKYDYLISEKIDDDYIDYFFEKDKEEYRRDRLVDLYYNSPNDSKNLLRDFEKCIRIEKRNKEFISLDTTNKEIIFNNVLLSSTNKKCWIIPDPGFLFGSENYENEDNCLSDLILNFDVVFEYGMIYATLRLEFFSDDDVTINYSDVVIYDSTTVSLKLNSLKMYNNIRYIKKISLELLNFQSEEKPQFKIKNISLNLDNSSVTYKEFINPFDQKWEFYIVPNDTSSPLYNNYRFPNIPSFTEKPKVIISDKNVELLDVDSTEIETEIENKSIDDISQNFVIGDIIDVSGVSYIRNNKLSTFSLINNKKDNNFTFFIFIPETFWNSRIGPDFVRFSLFIKFLNIFKNNAYFEIIGFNVYRYNINNISTFEELKKECYERSDRYFKINTKNSGRYYTFFDRKKVNVIGIRLVSDNVNIDKKSVLTAVYSTFEDFRMDRRIIFSENKDFNDLCRYDAEILRITNSSFYNSLISYIEKLYKFPDRLETSYNLFVESFIDDIFVFYKLNDVGISFNISQMSTLISRIFYLKKALKIFESFKPIHSRLLPPMIIYSLDERMLNSIFVQNNITSDVVNIVKEERNTIFTLPKRFGNTIQNNVADWFFDEVDFTFKERNINRVDDSKRYPYSYSFIDMGYKAKIILPDGTSSYDVSILENNVVQGEEHICPKNLKLKDFTTMVIPFSNVVLGEISDQTFVIDKISVLFPEGINFFYIYKDRNYIDFDYIKSRINIVNNENYISIDASNFEESSSVGLFFGKEIYYLKLFLDVDATGELKNFEVLEIRLLENESSFIHNFIEYDTTVFYYPKVEDSTTYLYISCFADFSNDSTDCLRFVLYPGENIISSGGISIIKRPISGIFFKIDSGDKIEFINTKMVKYESEIKNIIGD